MALFHRARAAPSSTITKWINGPPQSPDFFPIAVWWQAPTVTGHSGAYANEAAAAAAEHINIFLGIGPSNKAPWPEYFGRDDGELELIKSNNLYLVSGISTPYAENKSAGSVASVLALANSIGGSAI